MQDLFHDQANRKTALPLKMEQYQRLLAAAADFFYTMELEGGRPLAPVFGEGIAAVTGYGAAEYRRDIHLWGRLIPEEDLALLAEQIAALLAGAPSQAVEHRLLRRDGSPGWVRNIMVPRYDDQGELVAIDGLVFDLTEQKNLKKQLLHVQKIAAVGQLSLGISHDFNNILAVILGFTELVKMRLGGDEQLQGYLDRILTVSCRGRELVKQILAFGRSGVETRRPLEVQQVIKEAVHLLQALLPATIEIREESDQQRAMILAEPAEIHQVIMNLAINAWHAMPQGGTLRIGFHTLTLPAAGKAAAVPLAAGQYVCLEVVDNGEGVAADILPHIFEPHFTTKDVKEGSGLGLFMVREIAANLDGAVEVESKPGAGCTVRVFFPSTCREEKPAEIADSVPSADPAHILVADDDPLVLEAAANILAHFGHEVAVRKSGAAVLDLLRGQPGKFDLVILDQIMPGLPSLETAAEIRRLEPDLPLVLMAGLASELDGQQLRAFGIREVIVKPVTAMELGRTVGRILQEKQS
jgi:two-component system, cell cycle sensor histidine kinase and response regulator CckA